MVSAIIGLACVVYQHLADCSLVKIQPRHTVMYYPFSSDVFFFSLNLLMIVFFVIIYPDAT